MPNITIYVSDADAEYIGALKRDFGMGMAFSRVVVHLLKKYGPQLCADYRKKIKDQVDLWPK